MRGESRTRSKLRAANGWIEVPNPATWKEDYELYLQELAQFESHTVLLQTMLEDLGAPPVIDLIGAALTLTATGVTDKQTDQIGI